jgi:hypothetical protein
MNISLSPELLRADVRDGFNAVERGKFVDYDETNISELVSRVKARGLKRLEEDALETGPR